MAQAISLFLHSTGTTPAMWASVPADIIGDTKKIAPTHIGYPGGPPLARGQTCTAADDLKVVMSAIPPEGDVHVYAHSYGALVATLLLRDHPTRVKSAFLWEPVMFGAIDTDPATDAEARTEAEGLRDTHPWFLTDPDKGGTDPWLEIFIDYWNRPGSWARLPPHMQMFSRHVGWKMSQEVRACVFEVRHFDEIPIVGIPTTVVMGERSPKASRAMARGLVAHNASTEGLDSRATADSASSHATRLPVNAERGPLRLVDVPGTGHMAPLTHPDKVWAAMREHIAVTRA